MKKIGPKGQGSNEQRRKGITESPWTNTYVCPSSDAEEMTMTGASVAGGGKGK